TADGTVQYVDCGFTFHDGRLSKRFIKFDHDIRFDADKKRPAHADIVFTDEDGQQFRVTADATHQDVNVYYGVALPNRVIGDGMMHSRWSSHDPDALAFAEAGALSMDQLMHFECDGMLGGRIFELSVRGDGCRRSPRG